MGRLGLCFGAMLAVSMVGGQGLAAEGNKNMAMIGIVENGSQPPTPGGDPGELEVGGQALARIASLAAQGDLERLKPALAAGLGAGLTVNEIREALIQLYAYAGFPRSLNALNTFMTLLEERRKAGIRDAAGAEPVERPAAGTDWDRVGAETRGEIFRVPLDAPPAPYQVFAPGIDQFLKEHLFGAIFARGVLTWRQRELVTLSILASIDGLGGQLGSHFGGGMNVGLSGPQLRQWVVLIGDTAGKRAGDAAGALLDRVAASRSDP